MIDEKQMQHGADFEGENPQGFFVSEKLDGCRGYFDGSQFWTRGGNIIHAPDSITRSLPRCHLDGEFYAGRGRFTEARLAVQFGKWTPAVRFVVFDVPQAAGDWPQRIESARAMGVETVRHWTSMGAGELLRDLQRILAANGEGLIARQPGTAYRCERTRRILKLKTAALAWLYQMEHCASYAVNK